jgi:5-methylcytosine-specific restriction protein A
MMKPDLDLTRLTDEKYRREVFYHSNEWMKLSKIVRQEEKFCRSCSKKGVWTITDVADHILPVDAYPYKALDRDNVQGLCHRCHNEKTAKEVRAKRYDPDPTDKYIFK